jgi:hypothetical protein
MFVKALGAPSDSRRFESNPPPLPCSSRGGRGVNRFEKVILFGGIEEN